MAFPVVGCSVIEAILVNGVTVWVTGMLALAFILSALGTAILVDLI
jgi:hypothetical protein